MEKAGKPLENPLGWRLSNNHNRKMKCRSNKVGNDRQDHVVMNDLHELERIRHVGLLEIDANIVERRLGRQITIF